MTLLSALVVIYFVTVPLSVQSSQSNDEDLIRKARGALYNLNRQGFSGFKASVEPNWEVILGPTATPESLRVFRAVRFKLTVDANGAVTVSHEVSDTEKNRVQPYLKQIHDNVQRFLAAFFSTWATFAVRSPFPETQNQIRIEQLGREYLLSYSTQSSNVHITMGNDLIVAEWKLSGPRVKQTIKPLYQTTAEGLLLIGYQTLFEPIGEGIRTSLDVSIEYQDVAGLKLPGKVRFKGVHGNEPVEAELRFEQCELVGSK